MQDAHGPVDGVREPTLDELKAVLLDEQTVDNILELVAKLTFRAIGDAVSVSVTLLRADKAHTSNYSSDLSISLDQVQYEENEGPCLDAARSDTIVNYEITADKWPRFSVLAHEAGVRSILSIPLRVQDRTLGALNVYGANSSPFSADDQATACLLAEQATIVVENAMAYANAESVNNQLREALETRDLIGQAKGILMERQGISGDRAFDMLRRSSQRTNNKLRVVASELVAKVESRSESPEVTGS